MSGPVYCVVELAIHPGKLETFKTLARELTAATRDTEPGVLAYDWSLNDDETTCHLFERYKDSAAALAHLSAVGEGMSRMMQLVKPTRLTVYGSPSAEVQKAIVGMGPVLFKPMGGFFR